MEEILVTILSVVRALGIRSATEHLTPQQAEPVGIAVGDTLTGWIQSKGEPSLTNAIQQYPANLISLIRGGNWWGITAGGTNPVNVWAFQTLNTQVIPAPMDLGRLRYTAIIHAHWVARNVDAARFNDDFARAYSATLRITLAGVVTGDIVPPGIDPTLPPPSGAPTPKKDITPLLLGGLALALFAVPKKGK